MLKITKNQGSIQVTADKSGFYPFDGTLTFPTNSLFTATSANTDMITFKSTSNGDVQFVGNYKDITISGRSYDTKQKFLTAFSNLANQSGVDAYTKAETDAKIDTKQGKLKAGNGITLTEDATDNTTVVKTAVSLTDNGNGAYTVGNSIKIGSDTVAIGKSAESRSKWSIAIGKGATSGNGGTNLAIGNLANSSGGNGIAIGSRAETTQFYATAIGTNASAYIPKSIAIGYGAEAVTNKPMVINAGGKTMIQGDANGKISILKGDGTDERMVIQDEIEALKNAGGSGGTVDAYTKAETDNLLNAKQNTLTAGTGITIDENNVISSTGGSGGTVDAYTKAETDAKIDAKQNKLKAGNGITLTEDETDGTTVVKTKLIMSRGPYDNDGIRIGRSARVESINGIAFGDVSLSKNSGIAIGYKAMSSGSSSIVIGKNSSDQDGEVVGTSVGSGVVIGDNARGSGAGVVIGTGTHGGGAGVVIGGNSTVDGNGYGYAIGDNVHISETTKMVPIAIGYGAVANETKPLAVTILKITDNAELKYCDFIQGDANGKISLLKGDGTDERMVIQDEIEALKNAGGSGGSANPYVNVKGVNESAAIADNVTFGIAIGERTNVTKDDGIAIGDQSKAQGRYCVSVGCLSTCIGDSTVAIGDNAKSTMTKAVAIGSGALAMSKNAIAIGSGANANDTTPLVIKAGKDSNYMPLTVLQSDANGKLSVLKGDGTSETMCLQDEIAALKAEIAALKGGASTGDTTGA